MSTMSDFDALRARMVEQQIATRGVNAPNVLAAMKTVPRHRFVPEKLQTLAYADGPLPISEGQTISQPYIVALMAQAAELTPTSNCLEIGTGSGYSAAVLSRIAAEIYTVERIASLTEEAKLKFTELGYTNIFVKVDDGTLGWPEHAPYDAIIVTAAAPDLPHALIDQLNVGGRLIIPVGDRVSQQLLRLRKTEQGYSQEILEFVRFVPLIGKDGFND